MAKKTTSVASATFEIMKTSLLEPCPWNPRTEFNGEPMTQLVESIKSLGILEPLIVRTIGRGKKCQIVAGERRYLAAKKAKLTTVPVIVRELSDREARELTVVENLQREDLNPIDEARGFALLLEGDDAPTQTQLAERLGCSQAHIANRLRLLKLPADWHERIISGEIPCSYAREVVPFAKYPTVIEAIGKEIDVAIERDGPGGIGTVRDFSDFIEWGLFESSRDMNGGNFNSDLGRHVPPIKPTAEQEAELQIIEVQLPGLPKGKPSRRAVNVELFDKLQAAHIEKLKAAKDKKGKAGGKGKAAVRKLTPAELRARAKERARQFRRWLWDLKIDWIRCEIAKTLREYQNDKDDLLVILLWFAAAQPSFGLGRKTPMDIANQHLRAAGLVAGVNFSRNILSIPPVLDVRNLSHCDNLGQGDALSVICKIVAGWFATDDYEPLPTVPDDAVLEIDQRLDIDLAKEWHDHRAGKLTERYFKLHDRKQLIELASACKVRFSKPDQRTKGTMVAALMAAEKMPYPKELFGVKRPR